MIIEQPHGYLLDEDGKIYQRFGNWSVGETELPDVVESVEYVDGPSDHEKEVHDDYKPDL